MMLTCWLVSCLAGLAASSDYGPVGLDSLDPLSLSWNQVENVQLFISYEKKHFDISK